MRGHLLVDVPFMAVGLSAYPSFGATPLFWLAGASVLIHTWGVANPRSSLYLPVWWRLPKGSKQLALTFDDGPNPDTTPKVLDLLAEHKQRATFFLIGQHVQRHPALVRRMVAEGHALGLHSHRHSRLFNCWTPGLIQRDLSDCGAAIADASGQPAPCLWRPPVGLKNPMVAVAVGRMHLRTVTWSRRALDTGSSNSDAVLSRLRRGLRPREILVMHDGHEPAHPQSRAGCVTVLKQLLLLMRDAHIDSAAIAPDTTGITVAAHQGGVR